MPKIIIRENVCKGCEMCVNACPKKIIALSIQRINEKGYHPAELLDESACTGCTSCAIMCPDCAIIVER
ncbi:MAG: 4Fe-4S binding protein [Bacillota bacterium]|nr:4Fe-4S binding protein [Bacillota bacterium]